VCLHLMELGQVAGGREERSLVAPSTLRPRTAYHLAGLGHYVFHMLSGRPSNIKFGLMDIMISKTENQFLSLF
jgi:hypothetical protein